MTIINIGFQVINEFAKENNFPEFRLSKKFNALISENILNEKKIILIKPLTFMNESGKTLKALIIFYKTAPAADFVVVHDDIDLPSGKIRISKNRGAAGHKGVESIIREIGTKDFTRFRVGISPQKGKPKDVEKYVLQKFEKEEEKTVKQIIKETTKKLGQLFG
jgi:PTH1 family peptidyl-tRNA hydrolase